ncbi:hypothetical protein QEZ40_001730 [Streptomyces katrae]|uniref:Secreted protein n=1 Tax=Streptomyces katrae TaxID=68223 RepID=A0ABT7GU18_9ACTN|nr:hypothetical protein [Streptomyces katrae]MDK9497077.1 hypothetical protein [Streptomyces katrae]
MNRLTLLAAGAAGLTALTALTGVPAVAATPAAPTETVTSCGSPGLQAGLNTRVCAEVTGTTVVVYGKVGLAGPPSPGSPAPQPKELLTTLSAEVAGGGAPVTQAKPVVFTSSALDVRGPAVSVPCGATVRAAFGVASFPWAARPVVHEVTVTC